MGRRVSLKEVAAEAGFSESAVSQVLNNRSCRLAEESKDCIRKTAKRMGYYPNHVARSLAMRRSDSIGLIVPDIENPFFASLAKYLEINCRKEGLSLFIANSDDSSELDCEQLRRFDALGIDGVVFVPSNEISDGEARESLLGQLLGELSMPYVMVDRVIDDIGCDKVLVDNEYGAYQAVDYLIEQGHSKIGCLVKTECSQNGRLRLAGYKSALAKHGIPFDPKFVRECDYHSASGYSEIEFLLEHDITAVFSASDLITAGAIERLFELDYQVPQDLSVVSFDRNESSALYLPRIASVKQNIPNLAAKAFSLLLRRINGYTGDPTVSILEPELVKDASVAAPRKL